MKAGRRSFLKNAGLGALGLAASKAFPAGAEGAKAGGGPRWAMLIDTRKCLEEKECAKCAEACHEAHNVPTLPNPRHEVKWIWKENFREAFPDQEAEYFDVVLTSSKMLVFCNHCDKPPCTRVCPTQATWRRADGVVMMDWHRCIGCRYCVAACPYGSRSFNWIDPRPHLANVTPTYPTRTRGVVEKCTFCEERLPEHRSPACVEACEAKAMMFGDLADPTSEIREVLRTRFAVRRRPGLGTHPEIFYLV